MTISELKRNAKAKLAGRYGLIVGILLIHLLLTTVLINFLGQFENIITSLLSLVVSVISVGLSYGLTASLMKFFRNEESLLTDFITIGLNNLWRAFCVSFSIFIRLIVPIILFAAAGILTIIGNFARNVTADGSVAADGSALFSLGSLALSVIGIVWLVYKGLAYSLATYLAIDNPNARSKEVIAKSCELMKGKKLKFVGLVFSFFGWLLLCGLVGGFASAFNSVLGTIVTYAGSLLLTPYMTFSEIGFYEDVAGISDVAPTTVETTYEPSPESTIE